MGSIGHVRLLTKLGAALSDGLFKSPSGLLLKQWWVTCRGACGAP